MAYLKFLLVYSFWQHSVLYAFESLKKVIKDYTVKGTQRKPYCQGLSLSSANYVTFGKSLVYASVSSSVNRDLRTVPMSYQWYTPYKVAVRITSVNICKMLKTVPGIWTILSAIIIY